MEVYLAQPRGLCAGVARAIAPSADGTRNMTAALHARFADIQGPDTPDICYATQNRQSAVRDLGKLVDVILVVGAANSSNYSRLREIGTARRISNSGFRAELTAGWANCLLLSPRKKT